MSNFSFKTFTSFLLVSTFVALVLSGIMLFLSPAGRVAHWTNWTLLGLGKEEWGALHILMAIVFLLGSLFHLLKFNWKVFVYYLKKKSRGFQYTRELMASLCVFGLVLAGTLMEAPPFVSVMALHDEIKDCWEEETSSPPVPHMELMSLSEIASNLQMSNEEVLDELTKLGIEGVTEAQTLKELADSSRHSPQEIFSLLQGLRGVTEPVAGSGLLGRGLGRKTLGEVSTELNIPLPKALAALRANGVEAQAGERIRDITARSEISPHELIELLGSVN